MSEEKNGPVDCSPDLAMETDDSSSPYRNVWVSVKINFLEISTF